MRLKVETNEEKENDEEKREEESNELLPIYDLNYFENWRNKAIDKSKRTKKSKYTHPNEEFEAALSNQRLTTPKNPLLKNSNLQPFVLINDKKV